ncbi:nuclear transport factor 2 family protein [Pinirhizobacter sp.]|jgi:predicted SnoaL-like aldol condensation-catalyzing enzyme|uniref:nuclear transport factor 2 family protein n=1 Tax=Pinirhizobacter sp. TaxID=2950432 RepID=UPI002F3EC791
MNFSTSIRRAAMVLLLAIPLGSAAEPSRAVVLNTASEEANKQAARNLYHAIFTARDVELAKRFLGPEYIQHAPDVADGKAGLAIAIAEIVKDTPQISYEIKHILAEDDMVTVMAHLRVTPDSRGMALFNIYRFDAGKIVEHWETLQEIPERSANGNGMF